MFNFGKKNKQTKPPGQPLPGYKEFLNQKVQIDDTEELPHDTKIIDSHMTTIFSNSDDFMKRQMKLPSGQQVSLYYIKGLIDNNQFQEWVIEPLVRQIREQNKQFVNEVNEVITSPQVSEIKNWKDLIQQCLKGQLICHIDGLKPVYIHLVSKVKRNPSDPTTEYQVYGPKMGFIEDSMTNVAMLRKYITDPRLKLKEFYVGDLSHTHVALLYVDEYVDPELLRLITERLHKVNDDNIVSSGQLEKHIIDHPKSIFPQVLKTERPDNASYALSQGKIVVIVDSTTFVLILPTTHFDLYLTSEDNYLQVWHKTLIRSLRLLSMISATILPAFYIALVAYHPELIPSTLALTVADTRNNIPFTAATEAFLMIFALDVLVESSMRLPMFVGQTVGIVGGLVIGQAAVEAGFISSTMIIVTAFTAISSFTTPSWDLVSSVRVIRYILLLAATLLGLFGLVVGLIFILIHLSHLTSLSKPYFSPISPLNPKELMHMFVRGIKKK